MIRINVFIIYINPININKNGTQIQLSIFIYFLNINNKYTKMINFHQTKHTVFIQGDFENF